MATDNLSYFDQILARKEAQALRDQLLHVPDSLEAWMAWYLRMSILGIREQQIATRRNTRRPAPSSTWSHTRKHET